MNPLTVWDCRQESWMVPQREARTEWLRLHGLPADNMYRAEFYLIDTPFVRVFTYHRNEKGMRHLTGTHVKGPHDHGQCEAAVNAPYDEPLWELPPDEIR